jgi:hypothetical protein
MARRSTRYQYISKYPSTIVIKEKLREITYPVVRKEQRQYTYTYTRHGMIGKEDPNVAHYEVIRQ